ncbi:hypothetical protein JYU29_05695 [Tianweitania sp. BSSL-BM11]|uniref:Uncharacterized protein n=1 Tax=Tianweitania aestuarii TaxID=2814886 RepID=A0ABS5RVD9_9HYPH|nr:hypothetical protein [Tianweitania aestuarii]MBS9720179.1 hypothetical protein [Tianweitania aestuarii]
MLAAEAMRLAAIEALCPTACKVSGANWPTLAEHRVYDSAAILAEELADGEPYTACLSLYTEDVRIERRGDGATSSIGFPTAVLVINVELATSSTDEDGILQVLPLVEDDPQARLVLGALCAQVRKQLVYAPAGSIFREIAGSVEDLRIETFTLPQFDIRWMRNTMRLTCRIKDDKFTDEDGMPEPMLSLFNRLPEGSYAKGKLIQLQSAFAATTRTPLEGIRFSTSGDLPSGPADGPIGAV